MPRRWEEAVALLAYVFHFQPSEIWEMEFGTMRWWCERADWILEKMTPRGR